MADFQQYYGIDLWDDLRLLAACDPDRPPRMRPAHTAALARQLPRDGRVRSELSPAEQHGTEALLLRRIEWDLRCVFGSREDGKDPEPLWLDGEEEAYEDAVEAEERRGNELAELFGLRL